MIGNFPVVVVCGSTRYKEEYEYLCKDFELRGWIVLRTSIFSHSEGVELTEQQIDLLEKEFKSMIEFADNVAVVTVNNYIGDHVKYEVELAQNLHKNIRYYNFNK